MQATNHPQTGTNGRWNGIVAYLIHDFNDQEKPNAFSFRARGEIWEDAGGSRACAGALTQLATPIPVPVLVSGQNTAFGGAVIPTTLPIVTGNPAGAGRWPDCLGDDLHAPVEAGSGIADKGRVPI